MARPISNLEFVRNPDAMPGERIELEVQNIRQPDRVTVRLGPGSDFGYGFESALNSAYGFGAGPGYGVGLYEEGYYGEGTDDLDHVTANRFIADDYRVRARTITRENNTGTFGDEFIVQHRPAPPMPTRVRIFGGSLTWLWNDP